MSQLCFVKGNVLKDGRAIRAYEKLENMSVTNSVTAHMEQMYYELKNDNQLWKDWDAYMSSYVHIEGFKKNWKRNQSDYSNGFRSYVNSKL